MKKKRNFCVRTPVEEEEFDSLIFKEIPAENATELLISSSAWKLFFVHTKTNLTPKKMFFQKRKKIIRQEKSLGDTLIHPPNVKKY